MTVFADTFALIAWLNPRDDAHALVTACLDGFTGRLVTTEWVLMELADALSAPHRAFDGSGVPPSRSRGSIV